MIKFLKISGLVLALFLLFQADVIAQQRTYTVGAAGYDPVAFFTENHAFRGIRKFAVEHEGVTYLFSSKENRDLFKENPEIYLPQYGGWCAYAMAYKAFVRADPEYWAIVDGKLYFNDHKSHRLWQAETTKFIGDGDKYWQSQEEKKSN